MRDGKKVRFPGIDSRFTRRENFSMPLRRLNLFLFRGERSPEPFQSLKPLGPAQARYFFFQLKDAHGLEDSSRGDGLKISVGAETSMRDARATQSTSRPVSQCPAGPFLFGFLEKEIELTGR